MTATNYSKSNKR